MRYLKILMIMTVVLAGFTSCETVRVTTDYDQSVQFEQYQSFAFYKPGIDQAQISDLDKRRILKAIDQSLTAKGMTKSKEADLLVSINTDAVKNINVYNNFYGYYGYYPWGGYPYGSRVSANSSTTGVLYIDLIDRKTNTLVWQGVGKGVINPDGVPNKKTERIAEMVQKILDKYPPSKQ